MHEDAPAAAAHLLERLRAGDDRAFEELVRTYQDRMFGVALRMLGNAAEAEEIAQEVFLRAHRSLGDFRGDARLSTWLYAIASRLCLSRRLAPAAARADRGRGGGARGDPRRPTSSSARPSSSGRRGRSHRA